MRDASDVARLRAAGARGFLVGEALMQTEHRGALIADSTRRRRQPVVAPF